MRSWFNIDLRLLSHLHPLPIRIDDAVKRRSKWIEVLERYVESGVVVRTGNGTKRAPYTYALRHADTEPGWEQGSQFSKTRSTFLPCPYDADYREAKLDERGPKVAQKANSERER